MRNWTPIALWKTVGEVGRCAWRPTAQRDRKPPLPPRPFSDEFAEEFG